MCFMKCVTIAAFSALLAGPLQAAAAKPNFTSFDPPGSVATEATGINTSGTITGLYVDRNNASHGFIRAADGTVTAFDPPGATATVAYAINAAGTAVGQYTDAAGAHCFIRTSAGAFTSFNLPEGGQGCYALGINAKGEVSGYEFESRHVAYGFLRKANGAVRTIRHANGFTSPASINNAGMAAGTTTGDGAPQGFVRTRNGGLTIFDAPGDANGTTASSINSPGSLTGFYVDGSAADHSYVSSPSGTITEFDPPGATASQSVGINDKGQITGFSYGAGAEAGFVRSAASKFTIFAAPDAVATYPSAINAGGAVAGYYIDAKYRTHGFLWTP